MGKKFRKLTPRGLTITGVVLIIGIIETCCTYDEFREFKIKSEVISGGDAACTIIQPLERSHSCMSFHVLQNASLGMDDLSSRLGHFQLMDFGQLKALFVDSYQREDFYVYACFSVP